MKAATTLRQARSNYGPALVALAAIHESHGAFLGGNFVDCDRCRFHAHDSYDGQAVEHDATYTFTRTYGVCEGDLVVIEERSVSGDIVTPTYMELRDALERIANGGPFSAADAGHSGQWWRVVAQRALRRKAA